MLGFQINSKGEQVLWQQAISAKPVGPWDQKTQRAASSHTTWASEGLSIWFTEVVILKPKLTEAPVKSAFSALVRGPYPKVDVSCFLEAKRRKRRPYC
jgi:hypothetical protein